MRERSNTFAFYLTLLPAISWSSAVLKLGTTLGTAAGVLGSTGVWYCIEAYGLVDDSAGVVTVKVNGVEVLALTGQDTRNGGAGQISAVEWEAGTSAIYYYIDDIVIRDDDWPGQGGLFLLAVDGDGSDTGWTASTGDRL